MSFDPAYLELMPSTMEVRDLVSFDSYAEPTFSTSPARYRCLVTLKPSRVQNFQGEEVVARTVAYVASTGFMSATAHYTLPDGSTPEIQSIETYYDEDGIHHSVCYFGGGG
jgi:hypothetical protein